MLTTGRSYDRAVQRQVVVQVSFNIAFACRLPHLLQEVVERFGDEAGLKSNRQGAEMLRLAQKHDLRVLLVGDVRQHVSVEAGDFLRVLETHSQLGRCRVGQIHRQRQADYRGAVERMAAGDVRGGLAALDRLGWITRKVSRIIWKRPLRIICGLPMTASSWIAAWPSHSPGRKIIASRTQSAAA